MHVFKDRDAPKNGKWHIQNPDSDMSYCGTVQAQGASSTAKKDRRSVPTSDICGNCLRIHERVAELTLWDHLKEDGTPLDLLPLDEARETYEEFRRRTGVREEISDYIVALEAVVREMQWLDSVALDKAKQNTKFAVELGKIRQKLGAVSPEAYEEFSMVPLIDHLIDRMLQAEDHNAKLEAHLESFRRETLNLKARLRRYEEERHQEWVIKRRIEDERSQWTPASNQWDPAAKWGWNSNSR